MQSAYIGKLMELAEKDKNVLHILADSGTGYDEMFRRNFPEQIYNFGIGEENMVAAAAGMATVGKIPFVFTAGAFLAYRCMEFIRDDVCFQNLNVKIVGMGSGLSWSSLGPTHHTTEDLSVLRAIPNLMILSPATPKQVSECLQIAYEHKGPVYVRIGMNHEKEFFTNEYVMQLSKNDLIRGDGDIAVYCTGSIIEEVNLAIEKLLDENIGIKLYNVATVKPFGEQNFLKEIKGCKQIITIEEHNVYGGIGGIISEIVASNGIGVKVSRIGIRDTFASGYGNQKQVRKANGLDSEGIYTQIKEVIVNE